MVLRYFYYVNNCQDYYNYLQCAINFIWLHLNRNAKVNSTIGRLTLRDSHRLACLFFDARVTLPEQPTAFAEEEGQIRGRRWVRQTTTEYSILVVPRRVQRLTGATSDITRRVSGLLFPISPSLSPWFTFSLKFLIINVTRMFRRNNLIVITTWKNRRKITGKDLRSFKGHN